MKTLEGTIAVVTGANRGIGKGIAVGLGESRATVYVTGRSSTQSGAPVGSSIEAAADAVTQAGGRGIAVRCDHRDDAQVEDLFGQIRRDHGRIDILVNNAAGIPEPRTLWSAQPFWETPLSIWDDILDVGLRSHFVASWYAAPMMVRQGSGLIVHVSSRAAAGPGKTLESRVLLPYSVGKAGLQRLTNDMDVELRPHGVTVLSIWPPATKTEAVIEQADVFGDLDGWSTPLFTGRVVAALARSGNAGARAGTSLNVSDLAQEFGVQDSNRL